MKSLSFASNINMSFRSLQDLPLPLPISPTPPRPTFNCSGKDILSRFSQSDLKYSPKGPDDFMALSLSNWLSMKVTRAELNAFQKELEAMAELFEGQGDVPGG
jgi:hypothetical protein